MQRIRSLLLLVSGGLYNSGVYVSLQDYESIVKQRDELVKQKDEVVKERDELVKQRDEVVKQRDEVVKQKDEVVKERDEQVKQKDEVMKERDELVKQRDEVVKQRDAVMKARDELVKKKDEVMKESVKERDELVKQRNDALKERDEVLKVRFGNWCGAVFGDKFVFSERVNCGSTPGTLALPLGPARLGPVYCHHYAPRGEGEWSMLSWSPHHHAGLGIYARCNNSCNFLVLGNAL